MQTQTRQGAPGWAGSTHYGLVILALVVLAVFASLGLARFGYTSILPAMQEDLGLNNTQTGELQSWNLAGYLSTVVFAGFLAARFGARPVVATALFITSMAMLLTGLLPNLNGARLGRLLAGMGGAGANVPAMALLSTWYGVRRRGLASGVGVAGSSVGLMITGPLVPWILGMQGPSGWRICWYVLAGMAAVVCLLCALFLRNRPGDMGLLPLGDAAAEVAHRQAGNRVSTLQWSLVYRSGSLWRMAAVYFGFGFSYIIYSTFLIRFLVKEAGFTQVTAGQLWLTIGLVSGFSGILWGGLSDRLGRKFSMFCVFVLQGLSFLVLGMAPGGPMVYLSAGLFAITAWSIPALMAAAAGDVFGGRLAPAALGLMTVIFGLGQALGPYLAGRIADATHSLAPAFVLAGATALLLGAGGTLLLRLKKEEPQTDLRR